MIQMNVQVVNRKEKQWLKRKRKKVKRKTKKIKRKKDNLING